MALIQGTGAGGGRPLKKKKKKPPVQGRGGVSGANVNWSPPAPTKAVPTQNLDKLYNERQSVSAYPFKDHPITPKYATESKRLVGMLGIDIKGMDGHPDPNAVYTAIGQALHKLPAPVVRWLQDNGNKLHLRVTPDGMISLPGQSQRAGGFYDDPSVTVGVPGSESYFQKNEFKTPGGDTVSGRSLTTQRISDIMTHEFAHWLDNRSDSAYMAVSKKHPDLFGAKGQNAPHDARRWERFAADLSAYLGNSGQRDTLNPNVAKFFDRFIGPQLSTDSSASESKGPRNEGVVKRIAAIKMLHDQGGLQGSPEDVEQRIFALESRL